MLPRPRWDGRRAAGRTSEAAPHPYPDRRRPLSVQRSRLGLPGGRPGRREGSWDVTDLRSCGAVAGEVPPEAWRPPGRQDAHGRHVGCCGHRGACVGHGLEADSGLGALHQRQVQEGRLNRPPSDPSAVCYCCLLPWEPLPCPDQPTPSARALRKVTA
ncbi:unnamed protein product [Gulo gulo]|uniref:Uncharacterized protein n=1 Tax=Gulo gulo TaxID=48420 RepID=A0A9X9LGZ7_GULGU|nr:unnamed protein product [Gulo gulo]